MTDLTSDDRVAAVEKIVKLFGPERFMYLTATLISFVAVVASAVFLFVHTDSGESRTQLWVALFSAPAGMMAFSCGQFLKMFSRAMDSIDGVRKSEEKS
jgi:cytochrome bd-type quinol oxidase subunit 1